MNDNKGNDPKSSGARSFTFRELAAATRGFREVNLLGEGGFGRVYKGRLETGQASSKTVSMSLFYYLDVIEFAFACIEIYNLDMEGLWALMWFRYLE
jgi:hypothetical protein